MAICTQAVLESSTLEMHRPVKAVHVTIESDCIVQYSMVNLGWSTR